MAGSALRRWWPFAAVVLLLALVAVASSYSSLGIGQLDTESAPPPLPGQAPAPAPPEQAPVELAPETPWTVPSWLVTGALALAALAALTAVVLLLRALLRDVLRRRSAKMPRAGRRRAAAKTDAEVVAALDAGLVDLSDSDADPRRAVIACWVRLEQAAAAAGVPRQVGDTPTDLVTRLLRDGTRVVSARVLAEFAEVYRTARYATRTVDAAMREQARSALGRLRAELTAPRVGPAPGGTAPAAPAGQVDRVGS